MNDRLEDSEIEFHLNVGTRANVQTCKEAVSPASHWGDRVAFLHYFGRNPALDWTANPGCSNNPALLQPGVGVLKGFSAS